VPTLHDRIDTAPFVRAPRPTSQRLSRARWILALLLPACLLGTLGACSRGTGPSVPAPTKVPTIGILTPLFTGPTAADNPLREALAQLGWEDGRTIRLEWRYGAGDPDRLGPLAAELVALNPDVIIAIGGAIQPARAATDTIPIVMVNAADPVERGWAESLARPGGNMTGLSLLQLDLNGKRLELLHELAPGISRVAIIPGGAATTIAATAASLGLTVRPPRAEPVTDVDQAFREALGDGVDAFLVIGNPFTFTNAERIAELAAEHRVPVMYDRRNFIDAGGLVAYGPDPREAFQRAAAYTDRILRGARPAELPIEQPARFEFILHLRRAETLGLTVPPSLHPYLTELIQ
jgi:putative tryptophan/tyrosine transport system substrate-binding protein